MGRVLESTAKRLFAVSGNECAFPKCTTPLVDAPSGKVTGRICHIKARRPGGPRYDDLQSDTDRDGFANLILLCGLHHDVIDADEESYTVVRLYRMKSVHEAACAARPQALSEELAHTLVNLSMTTETTVSSSNQSGGQVAYSIVNNYANKRRALAAKTRAEHDIGVFREADTLFNEDLADEFFSDLLGGHEYYSEHSRAAYRIIHFLRKVSNEFLDEELERLSNDMADSFEMLQNFIAMRFFIWPELSHRENVRYCLWPSGNIDRAGDGEPESERRYDEYLRELQLLVDRASSAMVVFRREIKRRLLL
jgi:hypothetical protein